MDAETKIKDKLEDLQRFRPLLEEMLKWSKVGEKNAAAREKLQKMYEIVIGQTPCTKLGNLIRIEEAILKWTQKKKESVKEPPVILNRLQHLKKRVAALQSLKNTELNQAAEPVENSKPIEVITLDSSDEDDIQIVSYTSPEPKKDKSEVRENNPSNKTDENKPCTSSSLKPEIKDEDENPFSELEDGEIEDSDSIISIVDGTGIELEDVENNFSKEKEHFPKEKAHIPKEIEVISKHGIEHLSKEAEHFYEEDDFSSLDSLESYHDKPALKTYGCRKISKTDKNENNGDLRNVLNAIRMSKKQNTDEPNISEVGVRTNANEPLVATSLGKLPIEETLVVEIRNRKTKVKKHEDDKVVNSNIPLREKIKCISEDNKSLKTSSVEKETENPQSIPKKRVVRVIEIVTEEPKEEVLKNTMKPIEQKTKLFKPKLVDTSDFGNLSDAEIIDSSQDAIKKHSFLTKEHHKKSSDNDKTQTKPDESHFDKKLVEKVSEENKISSTENKKRHCEKNKKSTENNEDIPIAVEGSKSDISAVANITNNQKTEKDTKDKYLDILYNIDLTPDSENELEKDQDLDIFDEAIYSGARRNSEAGQYERAPDVSRAEVSDRTNIPNKNEDISSSTLVKPNNYEKGKTTTASQSDLTMKQANSNILPSTSDSAVVWLHDSDTEEFIKKINLVIHSKAERESVEETSKEKSTKISIHTNQPTTKDKLPVNEEIAIVEKVNEQISTEQKASEIEYDPKSPTKNGIQTVEESINQIPFVEMDNSKILRSRLLEGDLGNTEQVLSAEKNIPNTDNDSNATSKILSKNTPSDVEPSNSSSTNSTEAGFKPITQEMLNDILVKIKEILKKSQSKVESSSLESEIEQESARGKVFEPELVDEKMKMAINLSVELATFAKTSIGAEAVSPQSEKPLFERRPKKKEPISRVIEAVQKSINHSESTENRRASSEDRTNASKEGNKTVVEFEGANAVVPQGQSMTSKVQLDEWANKDLSELQEIRIQLEKQLGVDLETILQADQDEESIFSSDNDVLATDVAQELEEAMQDDFLDELPEPEIPTFTSYNTPINFFAQSNFPISYNLPQYLGLPPEIQPNDPRLRSRLTLLYAKTTDPMQLKTPLFKRKPSVPTADEILGSQAGKVQEEIRKEIGDLLVNFQTAPKTTIHKNQPIPSTSSSNRPQARTYGEYKRLKQAAIQAEAARKRAAVEAANRAHQMELEAERERQKTLDTEKKRLRFNEFENSQDYETDADIILATRKRRSYILSSSSESESQPKKSPTKQRLRKKRIRAKSPQFSSENEIGHIFSIDSDTIDSTSNPAKFPSRANHEDTRSSNVLENLLNSHNLAIDTNNKERLKELAFTVMKSLLKEKKFEEFKKLLDSNVESNEKTNKKAVSPVASTSSKGEISNRELAALNKDLHDMFIRDDVLMIGKRKSSVRSLKRIEQHYKSTIPTKASAKEDSDKVIRTVYSDEDADTDNFEEYTIKKKQNVELINISKNCPTVKLKRLTQEEILKYTQLGHPDNSPENTEDDQNLLEPMKAVPFSHGVARRQSQSSRPKKETQNTNPNWHYKDPYYSKYCLICYKKFSNLVDHYVTQHPKDEIYIARLPQNDLLYLAENPGKANTTGEQNKKGQLKYNFKCFFCEQEMTGRFDKFSHHYASHTGEFPYECSACDFMSCFKSVATKHSKRQCKKDAKVLTYYAYDENATKINLYVCAKCNYMQLHKANVVLHLRKEHEYKFVSESDIKELLLLEHVEQNIEIVNEPVSTVPKADDVEIIFEIQTGSKIDLPIVKSDKDSETDSIISDISIDMKPGSFELDLLPNQLTTKNTSIAPDLSKFDTQGEQIVTVIHLPASVSNTTENKSGDKSNFEKLLEELNSTASASTQHVEPLVVAKPKRNSAPEPVLNELIQVKSEEKEEGAESKQEDHKTDQIKDNHINVDKSIKPNVSDSSTIETSPKEIKIKEEETNPLSEDIGVEEGQDSFITVIEIVNDDDETQIDLPINEPHLEPKLEEEFATDLPINEPHPEPKVEEEFAPLRIEHFGYQEIRKGEFLFHCLIDKCNFGVTVLFEVLQDHACADHDIKWSGKCNICKNELDTSTGSQPIEEELNHMLTVHIKELPESQNDDENHVQKLLKPWLSEIKSRKHKILCEAMQSEKSLSCLYKCMGNNCSFTAETKLQMSRHLAAHELSILRNPDPEISWLECSYCEFVAVKTLQILEHIDSVHSKSIFQCSRCFYRSCSSVNLEIHHDQYHHSNADKNKTIKCSGQLKRLKDEVERINKLAVQNIEALSCSVCGAGYIRRDIMIRHLQEAHKEIGIPKGFPIGLFSCIFCKFETDGLEEIRSHMANKHPDELLYIGVRGIGEKCIKKDIATIAYIGVEEKDDNDSQSQTLEPDMELSELTKSDLNKKYETFKKNLMSVRVLEKLCNPSITIDSDDESCGNEDAEVNDESTIALYQKLIEMLKYFIKSQSELNPCCICLEKINLEDQWDNHFKTAHRTVNLNAFQMCPLCPTLCSFWTYPSHYINIHNKRTKTYFCYFCGKNFNILSVAKLHLISHSVYEQAKLIRVKMKQDVNTVNSNKNDIDYQIILPRKYNRKITDIIKHMMEVLEKRKLAERQIVKAPVDLDNFTIDLNENIRGLNFPLYVAAPMRYVCTYCSVQLTDERSFEQHFKLYHSAFKVFKCPHCEVTLFNVNDFDRIRDHIRIHSGIFYMCSFCKMYTSNRIHLIEHLKRYKRDSVPIVVYARTAITVKHHFEIIHLAPLSKASGIKIKCLFCTMFEGSPKDLGEHLQNIHEFMRQYQCDYCAFRGDEENVDMHVINTHVKNTTGNINYGFRSKTIFQKNFNANKYVKRKSDDFACLPERSSTIEKKNKLEDSIIELNCEDKTEKPQSSGAPLRISVITDLPVQEFSINVPPAQSSLVENSIKEITVKVPSLQELTVKDPAKEISVKETPVEDSPSKKLPTTTFSRSLKCEFCPLKCTNNEDLMKHLNLRHGVTLLETSENFNQSVAGINVTSTVTTTAAESISLTKETRKSADLTLLQPPQKKIRLVPLEKLLDPKAKGTQIEHIAPKPAPIQIVQKPREQIVIQQPNKINITQSTLQAPTAPEYQTYVCKFTCFHCSAKFATQDQLAAHWQSALSCPAKWSIFICYHCNIQFSNFKLLATHWGQTCSTNLVNGSYRYRISGNSQNQLPDVVTNSFLEAMSKLPFSKSICFQCPDCSQAYFDQQICMNHIKTKMQTPYYCTYTQEIILYGCDECKVFFLKEQDAVRHISKHTFQFGCLFCQFAYKTRDELYAHYVEFHRSIERRHRCNAMSERNMEIYRGMLVVFPYGLILTKWNLRDTILGNMNLFARLIEEVNKENSTTAVQK